MALHRYFEGACQIAATTAAIAPVVCACGHFNAFGLEVAALGQAGVDAEVDRMHVIVARRCPHVVTYVIVILWKVRHTDFLAFLFALDLDLALAFGFNEQQVDRHIVRSVASCYGRL